VFSAIDGEKSCLERMAQRPRSSADLLDDALCAKVLEQLQSLRSKAQLAALIDELEDLEDRARRQGLFAAHLCPVVDIQNDGEGTLDTIGLWGVPKAAVDRLRELYASKLGDPDHLVARTALYSIFAERDSWQDYIDDYEDEVQAYTWWLFGAAAVLPVLSILALYFAVKVSPLLLLGFFFAGAAGSCVSVISRMPALEGSLSGELEAYKRRVLGRVATGSVASLVGCAGLACVPLSLENHTFADAIAACTTSPCAMPSAACTAVKLIVLLGVPALLGFSERTLTSFEQRVLGGGAVRRRPRPSRKA
jgi:hypothetical protein